MRAALAIAGTEARARGRLLLLPAVLGVIPPLVPLIVPMHTPDYFGGGLMVALGFLALLSLGLAPLLGATVITSDLVTRRIGFYLSRPVGMAALVGGKVIGGLAIVLLAQVLVLAPALLFDGEARAAIGRVAGERDSVLVLASTAVVLATVALFAFGLGMSLVIRLRSRALLGDAAGLLATALLLAWSVQRVGFWVVARLYRPMIASGAAAEAGLRAMVLLAWLMLGSIAVLTLVWLVSAGLALGRGRTDGARVHRTFSLVVWPVGLILTAAFSFLPDVFLRQRPGDPPGQVLAAGGGGWVAVGTPSEPHFLHPESGRTRALPWRLWPTHSFGLIRIARSAERVVWVSAPRGSDWPFGRSAGLVSLDLGDPRSALERIDLGERKVWGGPAVSPDGRWAVLSGGDSGQEEIWAADLVAGKIVFDGRLPAGQSASIDGVVFASPTVVRIFRQVKLGQERQFQIHELDLATGVLRASGDFADTRTRNWGPTSHDADRVITWGHTTMSVRDGRSGRSLGEYPLEPSEQRAFLPLDGGGVVMAERRDGRISVRHGTGGVWQAPIDLGISRPAGAAPAFGHLGFSRIPLGAHSVYLTWGQPNDLSWAHPAGRAIIDLDTHEVTRLEPGVAMVVGHPWLRHHASPQAGHVVAQLAADTEGRALFLYDPVTRVRRLLLGQMAATGTAR